MTSPLSAADSGSDEAERPSRSTMHRDLFWAYAASAARILSWAVVSAFVYRRAGKNAFAMLSLVRGTIGILNYTAVGLAPAMVRLLAESRQNPPLPAIPADVPAILEYRSAPPLSRERIIYTSGVMLSVMTFLVGLIATGIYAHYFSRWHVVPGALKFDMPMVVICIGLGTLLRLCSDAPGAVLQTHAKIALDNQLLAAAEVIWVAAAFAIPLSDKLLVASAAYVMAGASLLFLRTVSVHKLDAPRVRLATSIDWTILRRLLTFGSLVLVAQLADYLYAPTDYILIDHFLGAQSLAAYAPAVQLDAGLLTLVTALSAVLLPKAALAHAAGSTDVIRRYYLRGTLAGFAVLSLAAIAVCLAAPRLLKLWLGSDPGTTFILTLVLIHTVIGGSSAVGRSILLAMGKFKPFTASVLIAGATNVIASYCFVKYLHGGLRGIVLGTIVAVVGRCVLWMPWYVMRTLRRDQMLSSTGPMSC